MLIHPQFNAVAVQLGPLAIHWYGLTYLVAFGLFLWLASLRVGRSPFAQARLDARAKSRTCCSTACSAS